MVKIANQESELDKTSRYDSLTNILNRYGLVKLLDKKTKLREKFFLVFIDLDNFKAVNDTLGHDMGDLLLQRVAHKWSNLKSFDDTVIARLGGDEFALIINTKYKDIAIKVVEEVISSIRSSKDQLLGYITASAGITSYPEDAPDTQTLLSYADTAMYKAKSSGKNTWQIFDKSIYDEIRKEYETKKTVKDAIENKLFDVVYQPQFMIDKNKIYGFEALLRLYIGNKLIPTQYIIDIAEKSGLIYDIDLFVLDKVTKDWSFAVRSNPEIILSVNISGKHICLHNFVDDVINIISKNSFSPRNLCIEITEGSFVQSMELARDSISKLRTLGIKIALDDFGTGYSSLKYLKDLTTNHLKIEKSFTDTLIFDASDNNIVNIIINIGHLLNCTIIAEGVETEDQLEYLKSKNCDIIQGYLLSQPITLEAALNCI